MTGRGKKLKTNISIELSDEQRNKIARRLDGKDTKRLISRAEVVTLATDAVMALLAVGKPAERVARVDKPRHVEPPSEPTDTPRAVVELAKDIPCERPTTVKDFPELLADFYMRAVRGDESLHSQIIWECQRRGIKVK